MAFITYLSKHLSSLARMCTLLSSNKRSLSFKWKYTAEFCPDGKGAFSLFSSNVQLWIILTSLYSIHNNTQLVFRYFVLKMNQSLSAGVVEFNVHRDPSKLLWQSSNIWNYDIASLFLSSSSGVGLFFLFHERSVRIATGFECAFLFPFVFERTVSALSLMDLKTLFVFWWIERVKELVLVGVSRFLAYLNVNASILFQLYSKVQQW